MMSEKDDRTRRWMAYFLDEVPPEQRPQIEAELRAAPEEAAEVLDFMEQIADWAKEPVPYTPLDLNDPQFNAEFGRKSRRFVPLTFAWPLRWVAVAIVLLALTQLNFSITVGDKTLRWGSPLTRSDVSRLNAKIACLETELQQVQQDTAQTQTDCQTVALKNLMLEKEFRLTTAQLARNQQIETVTRYRDTQNLIRLAGYDNPAGVTW
ncbi:MAG: hypothetical protein JW902_02500 [Syntrophaceae bacterium]|nr:hypothetical protein [Syntrophaceae bacterium]